MNIVAIQRFREMLARDETAYGMWVSFDAPSVTEIAVALGLDWVVFDAEHGHLDWGDIVHHLRAGVRSNTVLLVRIAETNAALVKRALDLGADGVVVPWVETKEQLEQIVSFAHYPTRGIRGIGGERGTGWGQGIASHVEEAEANVLVIPIIESVKGGSNVEQLVKVDGVDVFYIGPADYSATAGHAGQWEGPGVGEEIQAVAETIRDAGKHCGVVARDIDDVHTRAGQGFRMIGFGHDGSLLIGALRERLSRVGREVTVHPSLNLPES
jgi:2-keto-3-deoxy-L-rhamnonate aldolase RhmA